MFSTTRKEIFSKLMEKCDDTWDVRYEHANVHISSCLNTTLSESQLIILKVQTSRIFSKIKERWGKSSRNREKFFQKNDDWLKQSVTISLAADSSKTKSSTGK